MSNLKPCPFCGAMPIIWKKAVLSSGFYTHRITCPECKLQTKDFNHEHNAIEYWNNTPKVRD